MGAAVALALFLLVGLLVTQVIGKGGSRTVAWTDLTDRLGPVGWPRQTISVIRTRAKLEKILDKATLDDVPEPPPIDFGRRQAILYAVGPRSSTGYRLHVVRVSENGERVLVVLRELTPTLGRPVVARITFPYRLITIPRSGKRVAFRLEGRP